MSHIRAKIKLNTMEDVQKFIYALCTGNDFYDIENFDGTKCVNARSLLGMLYAVSEFPNELYLVNIKNDGIFPHSIDEFR